MKKYIYLVVLFFSLAFAGCKKSYLDINSNPNDPTEELITADLILPQALNTTATNAGAGYSSLARWMGYWTRGGDYGPSNTEESYNLDTDFGAASWASWYNNLYDYDVMQKKAIAAHQPFFEGIARAMKTVGFMYLVDTYNNVPYTEAFDVNAHILPAYDKGSDIYKDLFLQLDQALVLIDQEANGASTNLENVDIMFHGDPTMWKKFINTQRLRLVMHLSNMATPPVSLASEIAKVTSEGYLGSGETAEVDPGYKKATNADNISQQNPFWNAYKADPAGTATDKYNRANNYVLNIFQSTNDIRYQYFFDPAITPLGGVQYYGFNFGEVLPAGAPTSNNSSGVGGPGVAKSFDQPQWMLTSVESLFLQLEAANRGIISSGPSLEDAIVESFVWLGVDDAEATAEDYIAANPSITSPTLANIYKQKYLALTGINNFEAWVDYRRVNKHHVATPPDQIDPQNIYPNIPLSLSPNRQNRDIPLRFKYPKSEYDYNSANVAKESDPDPQTSAIFWDTN